MADDAGSSGSAINSHSKEDDPSDEPKQKKHKTDNANNNLPSASTTGDPPSFAINHSYTDSFATLKELYENSESVKGNEFVSENFQVIREPFQVVQLKNFIQEEKSLHILMDYMSVTSK